MFDPRGKVIAVIHLPPLPGAPRPGPPMPALLDGVREEAVLLEGSGVDALLVENFGDAPFRKGAVDPWTVAAMTACVLAARQAVQLPVGLNVLRNDAAAALGIAAATGAAFIRVNVHVGVRVTDQGIVEGAADRTLRLRRDLGVSVALLADVDVKHSAPLAPRPVVEEALEVVDRGLADAVILTGHSTGAPIDPDLARALRGHVNAPLLAGSGATPETIQQVLREVDGVIVGSTLRAGGRAGGPLDPARVTAFMKAARRG